MSDYGTPPPPPGGGYGAPPPGGGYGAPMPGGAPLEHPKAQQTLILSIVGLLCCAPLAIYTLITSNNILKEGAANPGLNVSKANTARIISIVALVLWVVGFILNVTVFRSSFSTSGM